MKEKLKRKKAKSVLTDEKLLTIHLGERHGIGTQKKKWIVDNGQINSNLGQTFINFFTRKRNLENIYFFSLNYMAKRKYSEIEENAYQ